jgi:hypothetical protein
MPGQNAPQQFMGQNTVINGFVKVERLVRPNSSKVAAPEHTPLGLTTIFDEGVECPAIGYWNASGAMFRKILTI